MSARLSPLFMLAVLLAAAPARAFHAAKTFADPAEQGGGGGIFYAGAPDERGWTCAACHTGAPEKMKVRFITDLFDDFRYVPGQSYDLTLRIDDERMGLGSARSNYNGFVLRIADDEGAAAGTVNAAADQFYQRATSAGETAVLATIGMNPRETRWTWTWIAPEQGRGDVTFYLGVVDGNGANAGPDKTRNDPFGDDVYVAKVTLHEGKAKATAPVWRGEPTVPPALAAGAVLLLFAAAVLATSRRAGSTLP